MSSLTSRGFLVPAVTDNADETLYYDNNITLLEAELPSNSVASLPTTNLYSGKVASVNRPPGGSLSLPNVASTSIYDGTNWDLIGEFGNQSAVTINSMANGNGGVVPDTSGGVEVFQATPIPNFSLISINPNSLLRFIADFCVNFGGSGALLNGLMNIFINPNGTTQPTPSTSGAIRLSFPINHSDDAYIAGATASNGFPDNNYAMKHYCGEMFWQPPFVVLPGSQLGVSAYLSAKLNTSQFFGSSKVAEYQATGFLFYAQSDIFVEEYTAVS